jgi:fatty acyl-ACP thioesterase B
MKETALNHVWMSGLLSDGFGATHGMMRNDLIWVVSRMQVLIDYYPIWLVFFLIIIQRQKL